MERRGVKEERPKGKKMEGIFSLFCQIRGKEEGLQRGLEG